MWKKEEQEAVTNFAGFLISCQSFTFKLNVKPEKYDMNLRKLAVAFSGGFPDNPSLADNTIYGIVIFLEDFAGQFLFLRSH